MFVAALAAVAAVGTMHIASAAPRLVAEPRIAVLLGVALLFALAELAPYHVPIRGEAYSNSLTELPLLVGLVFLGPQELIVASIAGVAPALLLYRRQPPLKVSFNLALVWLEAVVAFLVFDAILGAGDPFSARGVAAFFATALVIELLAALAVAVVAWLAAGDLDGRVALRTVLVGTAAAGANTALGVLAVVVVHHEPTLAWLVGAMAGVVLLAYRSQGRASARRRSMEYLYDLTADALPETSDEAAGRVLAHARDLLRASRAELVLGDPPRRVHRLTDKGLALVPTGDVDEARLRLWEGARYGSILLRPERRRGRRASGRGSFGAVAVPLRHEGATLGVLVVEDRLGDTEPFTRNDLRLLETLANHVTVTLLNGRLVERLQQEADQRLHEATHDALTGLPSRARFLEEVDIALRDVDGPNRSVHAVMLIDLDHFKEINDTLGHHVGDALLVCVAEAFRAVAREEDMVARLGGDEFAILARDVSDPVQAMAIATRFREALSRPFDVDGLPLEVDGSTGVALAPRDGADAATLLRSADVAMYAAKGNRSGTELYASERDAHNPRRLALLVGLRAAIDNAELLVHYQPKAELPSGEVHAVEALVRWHHPEHGFIPAEEFVAMAEHAGLMQPLTSFVLREAVGQLGRWRRAGLPVEVAVNLSTWNLLDRGLVAEIDALLDSAGVPPSALRLEITESSVMADPHRTASTLRRFQQLGVSLSLDDFGTGYSSLAWLKELPVDEVKLDRAFTRTLLTERRTEEIVRATVGLGRALGLRVLAEGVEDTPTCERLSALGCDAIQGYLLTHPLDAERCTEWLRRYRGTALPPLLVGAWDRVAVAEAVAD